MQEERGETGEKPAATTTHDTAPRADAPPQQQQGNGDDVDAFVSQAPNGARRERPGSDRMEAYKTLPSSSMASLLAAPNREAGLPEEEEQDDDDDDEDEDEDEDDGSAFTESSEKNNGTTTHTTKQTPPTATHEVHVPNGARQAKRKTISNAQSGSAAAAPRSVYRGVSWDRRMRLWRAKANAVHIGFFESEEDAGAAYDRAKISLHRRNVWHSRPALNFPEKLESYLAATATTATTTPVAEEKEVGAAANGGLANFSSATAASSATSTVAPTSTEGQMSPPKTLGLNRMRADDDNDEEEEEEWDEGDHNDDDDFNEGDDDASSPRASAAAAAAAAANPRTRTGPAVKPANNRKPGKPVSQFRGVLWDSGTRSWRAKIKIKQKTWYLGVFHDESVAAQAYDSAAYYVRKDEARLNFPDTDYSRLPLPRAPPEWVKKFMVSINLEAMKTLDEEEVMQTFRPPPTVFPKRMRSKSTAAGGEVGAGPPSVAEPVLLSSSASSSSSFQGLLPKPGGSHDADTVTLTNPLSIPSSKEDEEEGATTTTTTTTQREMGPRLFGITLNETDGAYDVHLAYEKHVLHLGVFPTLAQATTAYDTCVLRLFGAEYEDIHNDRSQVPMLLREPLPPAFVLLAERLLPFSSSHELKERDLQVKRRVVETRKILSNVRDMYKRRTRLGDGGAKRAKPASSRAGGGSRSKHHEANEEEGDMDMDMDDDDDNDSSAGLPTQEELGLHTPEGVAKQHESVSQNLLDEARRALFKLSRAATEMTAPVPSSSSSSSSWRQ